MEIQEAISYVEEILGRNLDYVRRQILEVIWENKTYQTIDDYAESTIKGYAAQLLQDIGEAIGEKVTKNTVKSILEKRREQEQVKAALDSNNQHTEHQKSQSIDSSSNVQDNDYDKFITATDNKCKSLSVLYCDQRKPEFKQVSIDDFFIDIYFKERELEEDKLVNLKQIVLQESKLLIRGEPGAGKSTVLKYIDTHIYELNFPHQSLIPIFIEVKDFNQQKIKCLRERNSDEIFTLEDYISYKYFDDNQCNPVVQKIKKGETLIFLDGLDELNDKNDLDALLDSNVLKNRVIISCRSGYSLPGQKLCDTGFKTVYLCNWNNSDQQGCQIENYAYNYLIKVYNFSEEVAKSYVEDLLYYIEKLENERVKEIVGIPLILNLILIIFVKEDDFPSRKSDLYRKAIDQLIGTSNNWNELSGRDNLNIDNSEVIKLLREIAATAFEQGRHRFSLEDRNIDQSIQRSVSSLSNISDIDDRRAKSEELLNSLEVYSGLLINTGFGEYTLSHATFQEYFTARHFLNEIRGSNSKNIAFDKLIKHLTHQRWREVFLLLSEMLQPVDDLIVAIKKGIDEMPEISEDSYIQSFLVQLNNKYKIASTPFARARYRAFYLASFLDLDLSGDDAKWYINELDMAYKIDPQNGQLRYLNDSYSISHMLFISEYGFNGSIFEVFNYIQRSFYSPQWTLRVSQMMNFDIFKELQESLKLLKQEIEQTFRENDSFQDWWQREGNPLNEKLKKILNQYRFRCQNQIGQYKFSRQQRDALQQYYDANQLLLDCLQQGELYISNHSQDQNGDHPEIVINSEKNNQWKNIKNWIESTLFLPKNHTDLVLSENSST